eukprot:3738783-Amphidinium_carterae.2
MLAPRACEGSMRVESIAVSALRWGVASCFGEALHKVELLPREAHAPGLFKQSALVLTGSAP